MLYIACFLGTLGFVLLLASWAARNIDKGRKGWR